MNFRIVLLLLLSCLLSINLLSQTRLIYYNSETRTYEFRNQVNPDSNNYYTSFFINEISLINGKLKSESFFSLKYLIEERIVETRYFDVIIQVIPKAIIGPVKYRNFDISDILIPSKISLKASVLNGRKQEISTKEFIASKHKSGEFESTFEFVSRYDNFSIRINDVNFFYTEADKIKFIERTSLINDYYAASQIIDTLRAYINTVDIENEDLLPENLIRIYYLKEVYNILFNMDLDTRLSLKSSDPLQYSEQLYKLYLGIGRLETLYKQLVGGHAFRMDGVKPDMLMEVYTGLMKDHIYLARHVDHYYQNLYSELINRSPSNSDISIMANLIETLGTFIPEISGSGSSFILFRSAYQELLDLVDYCIDNEYFNEAFSVIDNVYHLCRKVPYYCDPEKIHARSSRARHGLYNSLLRVAGKAIDTRNYTLAKEYIKRAENFQSKNISFIINNYAIERIYESLLESYILYAVELNRSAQYEAAVDILTGAINITNYWPGLQYNSLLLNDELLKARRGSYQTLLTEASTYFNVGHYEKARELLDEAQVVYQPAEDLIQENDGQQQYSELNDYPRYLTLISEGERLMMEGEFNQALAKFESIDYYYTDKDDDLLLGLKYKAAKLLVEKNIYFVNYYIWKRDLDLAFQTYENIREIIELYGLSEDEDLKQVITEVRLSLGGAKCERHWNEYESYIMEGFQYVDEKNFISAIEEFQAALKLDPQLKLCNLQDSIAIKALGKFTLPLIYQEMIENVNMQLYNEGFANVISDYLALEEYYHINNIADFGIEHLAFRDFLRMQRSPQLVLTSFEYFIQQEKYNHALEMLHLLYQFGYPAEYVIERQKLLAAVLLKRDIENADLDFDTNVANYTLGIDWFSQFKKAYNREARRHKGRKPVNFQEGKNEGN